jgi:hypothetical protein
MSYRDQSINSSYAAPIFSTVPIEVKELYTASLENRKSVTVIETAIVDGREPLPPFIIALG